MARKQKDEAGTELVVAGVGSVVNLDKPAEVAQALADVRALENALRDVKPILTGALVEESKRQGKKTLRFGDLEVVISQSREIVWDLEVLAELLDAGMSEERYAELVTETVTYKVSAQEAKIIAGANPEYARIIERARTDHDGPARASVS